MVCSHLWRYFLLLLLFKIGRQQKREKRSGEGEFKLQHGIQYHSAIICYVRSKDIVNMNCTSILHLMLKINLEANNHRALLMRWLLHKYKCLLGVGVKLRFKFPERSFTYIYTQIKLEQNFYLVSKKKKKKKKYVPILKGVHKTDHNSLFTKREHLTFYGVFDQVQVLPNVQVKLIFVCLLVSAPCELSYNSQIPNHSKINFCNS